MAKLRLHPIGLVIIIFGLLCWVVALGGLAASTKFCTQQATSLNCSQAFQLEWWAIWFQFFLLVIMLGTCFIDAFERARYIYLTYLPMVTFFLSVMARNFITQSVQAGGYNLQDYSTDAKNVAGAGAVLCCITNYLLMIFIGLSATGYQMPNVDHMTATVNNAFHGRFGAQRYEQSSNQQF